MTIKITKDGYVYNFICNLSDIIIEKTLEKLTLHCHDHVDDSWTMYGFDLSDCDVEIIQ